MRRNKKEKSKDVVRIRVYCHSGYVNCNHDYVYEMPKDEYDELVASGELEENLNELASDNMNNHIDYGAYVMDDDDEDNN